MVFHTAVYLVVAHQICKEHAIFCMQYNLNLTTIALCQFHNKNCGSLGLFNTLSSPLILISLDAKSKSVS